MSHFKKYDNSISLYCVTELLPAKSDGFLVFAAGIDYLKIKDNYFNQISFFPLYIISEIFLSVLQYFFRKQKSILKEICSGLFLIPYGQYILFKSPQIIHREQKDVIPEFVVKVIFAHKVHWHKLETVTLYISNATV